MNDDTDDRLDIGVRLKALRMRSGLSIRALAQASDVTAGMISCIERGKSSPSIALLQKVLAALGTSLGTFFSSEEPADTGPVFRREHMKWVCDPQRNYTLVYPHSPDIQVEMLDETLLPGGEVPPFETLACDIAGYVLSGELELEVDTEARQCLRTGDAFYVPKGVRHRGFARGSDAVRVITVYSPASY